MVSIFELPWSKIFSINYINPECFNKIYIESIYAYIYTGFCAAVVLPCSGASSAICHYSETALQTSFLIPDQKKKTPYLIMCVRPKGMTIVGCQ